MWYRHIHDNVSIIKQSPDDGLTPITHVTGLFPLPLVPINELIFIHRFSFFPHLR